MEILRSVEKVNAYQKELLFRKFSLYYDGDLKGKTVAVWGLSFKPETDDMRDAPSVVLIRSLIEAGCKVRAYDPIAMDEGRRILGEENVYYAKDMYDAVLEADGLFLVTEWKQFRLPAWNVVKKVMNHPYIVDGRNIYDVEELRSLGFDYECIGRRFDK